MNVNSGKRVAIAIGGYSGMAGFTEFPDGKAALSFPGTSAAVRAGEIIQADDRSWIVEKAAASQFLRGFKLVEMRPAEGV